MSSKEKMKNELIDKLSIIAKKEVYSPIEIRQQFSESFLKTLRKNKYRHILSDIALDFKLRDNYGRLLFLFLLSFSLERKFFDDLESKGILLSNFISDKKLIKLLQKLKRFASTKSDYDYFEERLNTYIEFSNLNSQLKPLFFQFRKELKSRSPFLVKSALCCSELFFMSKYYGLGETPVPNWLIPIIDNVRIPENLASIISYLIWEANSVRPLNPIEFEAPVEHELPSKELGKAVLNAKIFYEIGRISKLISCFQYSIQGFNRNGKKVYTIKPPSLDFEYYLRLGYIREELNRNLPDVTEEDPDKPKIFNLRSATKYLCEKMFEILADWVEEPYPRLRINFPYKPDGQFVFLNLITDQLYHEEKKLFDLIKNEHLIADDYRLTENLKITSFVKIFKTFLFLSLMNINTIVAYKNTKNRYSHNSLVRVFRKDNLFRLSSLLGIEKNHFNDFIDLISWDASKEQYYDMQYSPFLKCKNIFVSLPSVFSCSNILRNTQVSNKIRFKGQGDSFTDICTKLLKKKFSQVTSEKRIKYLSKSTEIDIIVFEKPYLYLFECKYSVPPCGNHELRDIWNDVKKGVAQQQLAYNILIDKERLSSYLAGWFPGTKISDVEEIEIKNCIILSGRNFSGMNIGNIAVRDFHSLRAIIAEQKTSFSIVEPSKKARFIKYSYVGPGGFSVSDLNNYLSPKSKFFKFYKEDMTFVSKLNEIIPGKILIAEESFIYEHNYKNPYLDYIDKMDKIGFYRLPDEEKVMSFPISVDEMKDIINNAKK
jgi:hypothetical protein